MQEKLEWEFFRDPIYNYIPYNKEIEGLIVDTFTVQRLRRIHQLQIAYLVYPGADHTRFQHAIGVMHLAGIFCEHILSTIESSGQVGSELVYDKNTMIEAIRLSGLMHDLGHGPYSHAFEEAILMSSKELKAKNLGDHEKVTTALIKHGEIWEKLGEAETNYGLNGLRELVIDVLSEYDLKTPMITRLLQKTIKNWVYPADIMDFLLRDSYYTGTREYGTIDYYRLIFYSYPFKDLIVLDEKALFSLKGFLQSRTHMFESVYFHPVCRSFDHMVQVMMKKASEKLELESRVLSIIEGDPKRYLELDDYSILYMIWRLEDESGDVREAKMLLKDLLERKMRWKPIGTSIDIMFPSKDIPFFLKYSYVEKAARDIETVLRELLEDSGMTDIIEDVWVDHSLKRTLPALPYPLESIKLAKKEGSSIKIKREIPIPQLLEESGLTPRVTFTVFGPYKLVKDPHTGSMLEKLARQAFSTVLGASAGITM